ncbi:DUF2000 domain-containing protein [Williamsia sterculiae]|uniref:DUF2000 domain-containing protein n=1 Tax=Williamsia sterculiae TaxID=1344003 RepID=A0A1N7GXR8_9NOCA|nr:DUF2000 domain-containing protein [Williamsia sterculiae]SIS17340.1 hypothetical protein SAMN05445060_3245 [Williamsia sterculiae]
METVEDPRPIPVRPASKIAVLLRDDLEVWQRLNITSFLTSGIAAANPDVIGEPYVDADGTDYLAMFRQPVLVFAGSAETLGKARSRAFERSVRISIFTADLFSTRNDHDNRAAVRAVGRADLDLVGIGLYAQRNIVDKIVKGVHMHP